MSIVYSYTRQALSLTPYFIKECNVIKLPLNQMESLLSDIEVQASHKGILNLIELEHLDGDSPIAILSVFVIPLTPLNTPRMDSMWLYLIATHSFRVLDKVYVGSDSPEISHHSNARGNLTLHFTSRTVNHFTIPISYTKKKYFHFGKRVNA